MKFDKTETLLTFLTCAGEKVRHALVNIDIVNYQKTTALPAMTMLSECKNIQRIHIVGGLGVNMNAEKAAKQFYNDAHRFFQIIGQLRNDPFAGIDMLSFGSKCFSMKDEDGVQTEWDDEEVDDFTEALRKRLL